MDELSQLDELIESDILEALGQDIPGNIQKEVSENEEEITIEDLDEIKEEEMILEDLDDQINASSEIDIKDEEVLTKQINSIATNETDAIQKIDANINTNDLGTLLSQLLTNKTIEITIKIKD